MESRETGLGGVVVPLSYSTYAYYLGIVQFEAMRDLRPWEEAAKDIRRSEPHGPCLDSDHPLQARTSAPAVCHRQDGRACRLTS